jgi:hypothetical protein
MAALAAGGLLAMLTDSLMPFAFERGGQLAGIGTILGFLYLVDVLTNETAAGTRHATGGGCLLPRGVRRGRILYAINARRRLGNNGSSSASHPPRSVMGPASSGVKPVAVMMQVMR